MKLSTGYAHLYRLSLLYEIIQISIFGSNMNSFENTSFKNTGFLILAYGGGSTWNKTLQEAIEPIKKFYNVEIAFGMANYISLYKGIQALENKKVNKIVVVQLFISSHSPLIQQNEFLLGKRPDLPSGPMPMMQHIAEYKSLMGIVDEDSLSQSSGGEEGHQHMYMPKNLKPIPHHAEIILTPALDDHPIVAQILHERIQELSSSPENETILLVAHGPISEDFNRKWIETMESLGHQIQHKQQTVGSPYKQIFCLTVRDDAPKPVYEQATSHLRAMVRQANEFGKVIVIPLFLSPGGREKTIAQRLKELDFEWNAKTLLPDPRLADYLKETIQKALNT
jgi:sirohydrochlorin ferrochelatase